MALSTSSGLSVAVAGEIWWGGFTAEITITNTTGSALSGWSYSFDSPHQLNSAPWGATLQAEPLDNGLIRYTLSGADWGAEIPAGGSVTVGFNGQQGVDLGVTSLSQELDSLSLSRNRLLIPIVDVVDEPEPVIEEPVMDHGSEDHSEMDHSGHDHGMSHVITSTSPVGAHSMAPTTTQSTMSWWVVARRSRQKRWLPTTACVPLRAWRLLRLRWWVSGPLPRV